MRFLLSVILFALVCAPLAGARVMPDRDLGPPGRDLAAGGSPLSLENGRGTATVRSRDGSIVGAVRRGRVRAAHAQVSGCETRRRIARGVVLCIGRDLTFWATGRRWTITVRGAGINAAGRLKGWLTLEGTRGTYALDEDGEDEHPWPRDRRTIRIG
jgi:hypothetical protein